MPETTLKKSYRGKFPFRIATTSFIYPDDYVPNVRRLGPCFDEIELLFFDSGYPGALPSRKTVTELARLADDLDLTYNLHLPTDVYIGDETDSIRQKGVDALLRLVDLTRTLRPTTMTLHLLPAPREGDFLPWQERLAQSLQRLWTDGVEPASICVENLDYPMDWIEPLVTDMGLCVCLDIGHLLAGGNDPSAVFQRYRDRTAIVHLHGVENGRDHLGLDRLDGRAMASAGGILESFSGVVSLEVFRLSDLAASLPVLEAHFPQAFCSGSQAS